MWDLFLVMGPDDVEASLKVLFIHVELSDAVVPC